MTGPTDEEAMDRYRAAIKELKESDLEKAVFNSPHVAEATRVLLSEAYHEMFRRHCDLEDWGNILLVIGFSAIAAAKAQQSRQPSLDFSRLKPD